MEDRKYHQGYFDCVAETLKFLIGADGSVVDEKLKTMMLQHLTDYYSETMTAAERGQIKQEDTSTTDKKCGSNVKTIHGDCYHYPSDNSILLKNNLTNNRDYTKSEQNKKRRFSSGKSQQEYFHFSNIFNNNNNHRAEQRSNLHHQHHQQQPLDLTLAKNRSKATNNKHYKNIAHFCDEPHIAEKMFICAENCSKCLREIQQNLIPPKTADYSEISCTDDTQLRKLLNSKSNPRRNFSLKVEQIEEYPSENNVLNEQFMQIGNRVKFEMDRKREQFDKALRSHVALASQGLIYFPLTVTRSL